MDKLIIKYSIIEAEEDKLYDIYYMDYYNNILSGSISLTKEEVDEVVSEFSNNINIKSIHYFLTDRLDLAEMFK